VNQLVEELRQSFTNEEYRYSYVESLLNSQLAAQLKVLREERDLTQEDLADKIGTKQAGISRLENVNYSSWKTETLRKLARALGVRLKISFEEFGTLPEDMERFNRKGLSRRPFSDDPVFNSSMTHTDDSADASSARQNPQPAMGNWDLVVQPGKELQTTTVELRGGGLDLPSPKPMAKANVLPFENRQMGGKNNG
jgi:transcriptional regulator with XRE-family HTH domain